MRKYTIPQSMTVEYLLGDHPSPPLRTSLGSTSLTTDANVSTGSTTNRAKVSEMRYCEASRRDKPCPLRYTSGVLRKGELRYTWTAAPATTPAYQLPNYTFTGQYSYMDDPSTAAVTEGFGLMFYVSRMYDPALGRFIQADSIIPGISAQAWDRYAYANNSPVRYTDPSGHFSEEKIMKYLGVSTWKDVLSLFEKGGKYEGAWGWLETLRRAELEDKVGWYDDYDIWSQVGFDTTIGSGMLTEIDGQLYLHNGDELTSISDAITQSLDSKGVWIQRKMHNGDYLSPDYMGLNAKNYHLGIKDDIDKIDLEPISKLHICANR